MSLRGKKVFSLITGASRGLGKFVAESMAGVIGPNSTLLLIAQDPLALTEVKANINQRRNDIAVRVECCNLAAAQFSVFESLLKDHSGENEIFETAVLIHNAASTGDVKKRLTDYREAREIDEFLRLNIASVMLLTNAFLHHFSQKSPSEKLVVNISATTANKSRKGLHLYGAGKAARNALFRGLADENPNVNFLSYYPGPIITRMLTEYLNNVWDSDCRNWAKHGVETGIFVPPDKPAEMLVELLDRNQFESGSFVDCSGNKL